MNTNIWANVFGVMGIVTSVIIYQQKENRNMLIWKLITDTVWVIHYLMLQANSVAVVTMVAMARSVILLCQNHAWARHKAWLWVFLGSSFLLSLLAWKDWTSGLVMVASLALVPLVKPEMVLVPVVLDLVGRVARAPRVVAP